MAEDADPRDVSLVRESGVQPAAKPKSDEKNADAEKGEAKPKRRVPFPALVAAAAIALVVLGVLAFWGGTSLGYAYAHESTDDAKIDADSITVTSKISERVDRLYTDTNRYVRRGQLLVQLDDRDERARLAAAEAARDAAAAQAQQAGAALRLTQDQVATETEQNRGDLESAHANVENARNTYASSTRQTDALRAAQAQAAAQLRAAQAALPGAREVVERDALDLARDSALVRNGDVSQSEVDDDRANYESALSQYREDEANVAAMRANVVNADQRLRAQRDETAASANTIGTRKGSVVTAQGRLAEAQTPYRIATQEAALKTALRQLQLQEAQVRLARDALGYTRIVSPVDGAVAEKAIGVGQTIGAGQTLFTIVPGDSLYITANFKETQLNRMRVGQPVDVHVDAYPEFAFVGHVGAFNPASQNEYAVLPPQNSSGNFVKVTQRVPVRIYVDGGGDPAHPLRPGMSVETYVRVR
jgi:membrane fusion protein (multidrug efflux system)